MDSVTHQKFSVRGCLEPARIRANLYEAGKNLTEKDINRIIAEINSEIEIKEKVVNNLSAMSELLRGHISIIDNHVTRNKSDLILQVDLTYYHYAEISLLLTEMLGNHKTEIDNLKARKINKAIKNVIVEKELISGILRTASKLGGQDKGATYLRGELAEVAKELRGLHSEYESHKKHSTQGYKSQIYKELLIAFDNNYLRQKDLTEEAKLTIAENMYQSITYILKVNQILSDLAVEFTYIYKEIGKIRRKGIFGFFDEL